MMPGRPENKPVIFHWLWEGIFRGAERIVAKAFCDNTEGPFEHRVILGKAYGPLIGAGQGRYCLNMVHGADIAHLLKIRDILDSVDKKILCLHQVNPYLLAYAPRQYPTVYVEHGQSRMWKGRVRDVLWRFAWRSANPRIAGIAAVSGFAQRIFMERNLSCQKLVTVIHNPLLIEPGQPRTVLNKPLRVGFCGSLSREKGTLDVIECAKLLHGTLDAEFVMIGDGPLRRALEKSAADLKLPFLFTGAVANVREYLMNVDVLLAPSQEDTFNLAVLEAMAVGAVPIVYPTGGLAEIVIHLENGIVTEEKSPLALARCLRNIAGGPKGFVRMSKSAYTRATNDFNLEQYRRKWDSFFSALL